MGSLAWNHGTCSCILFSNRNRCVVLFHLSWLIWLHCHSWCRLEDPGAEASHRRGDPCWCAALGATPGGQSRVRCALKHSAPEDRPAENQQTVVVVNPPNTWPHVGLEMNLTEFFIDMSIKTTHDLWFIEKGWLYYEWHNTSIRDSFIIWDERKYQWPITTLPPCVFLNRKLLKTSPGRSWSKPSGPKLMMIQVFFPRFFFHGKKPELLGAKTSSPLEDSLNRFFFSTYAIHKKLEIFFLLHNTPTMGTHRFGGQQTNTWDLGELLQLVFLGEERSCWLGRFGTSSLWQLRGELRGCRKSAEVLWSPEIFVWKYWITKW